MWHLCINASTLQSDAVDTAGKMAENDATLNVRNI